MAFTIANWACVSSSLNQGQETIIPYGGSSTVINAQNLFVYASPLDALATVAASNYFLSMYASLCVGDIIIVNATDGSNMYIVASVSSTAVTVSSFTVSGSVATANLQNNSVTFAKIQEVSTHTLVGNSTGGTTEVQEITLGNGLEFSGTTLRLPLSDLIYTTVAISASQFNGMYAAPKLLVAAGGADTLLVLDKLDLLMTYNANAYAAGGVAAVQYDNTVNGAGVIASSTLSAATFQAGVSTGFVFNGGVVPQTFSTCVDKGLYLSNISGAFTTGDSAMVAHIWYKVIPTV